MAESFKFGHWGITSEEILKKQFPLHRACRDGDVEALSVLLIEAQCGIYTEDSFYGWTPAHWAAYFGKLNCLMRLMECGVNCDAATLRLSQTPSHIAAFAGFSHCLKWLLHCGASINRQDYLGETPLHKAARTGSMECAGLLVSHGARLEITNNNSLTPARLAGECKNVECARYLESAVSRQENSVNHITGHISNGHTSSIHLTTQPSPHDVTCVRNYGLNGGKLPPQVNGFANGHTEGANGFTNGHSESTNGFPQVNGHSGGGDCDMVMEEMECEQRVNGHVENGHVNNGDVTLNVGVSLNHVPVAGKKRSREDDEGEQCKRVRTNEPFNCQASTAPYTFNNPTLTTHLHGNNNQPSAANQNAFQNDFHGNQNTTGDGPITNGFTQNGFPPNGANNTFAQNGTTNGFSATGLMSNGVEMPAANKMVDCSDSAVEHRDSVIVEQGYDSMFFDSVSSYHGS